MNREDSAKERIIALASERFLKEGYLRISVDELATDLAISKKTFYKFFEGKEDLIAEILDRRMGEIRRDILEIVEGDRTFLEKLDSIMSLMGETAARVSEMFRSDLQKHSPQLWKRIETFRRKNIFENVTRLLDQGIREGVVREGINKRIVVLAYAGAIGSVVTPGVLADESFSAKEALHNIMAIFFQGILTHEAGDALEKLHHLPHPLSS